MAGNDFVREIPVEFPETMASHDVLAPLWARARVDNLMGQDYAGAQTGNMSKELKDTITQLGIEYRLMTQFTSFVAVEEMIVTDGGQPRRIEVPIETPEGVRGDIVGEESKAFTQIVNIPKARRGFARGRAGNIGGGSGAGMGTGGAGGGGGYPAPARVIAGPVLNSVAVSAGKPQPTPQPAKVLSPEQQELQQKLHRSVLAVVEKLQRKEALSSADEAGFIRNGKAEVQIWLTEKSAINLAKLKELGFEVILDNKSSKLIIGRLPIEKLETLARLKFVKYVSPQVTK
jgi:hypothetical protein